MWQQINKVVPIPDQIFNAAIVFFIITICTCLEIIELPQLGTNVNLNDNNK